MFAKKHYIRNVRQYSDYFHRFKLKLSYCLFFVEVFKWKKIEVSRLDVRKWKALTQNEGFFQYNSIDKNIHPYVKREAIKRGRKSQIW